MSDGLPAAADAPVGARVVPALFDRLPELIVLIDANGAILHANQRLLDTMGYTLRGIVGSNIFDYVHPDDLAYMAWSWENREANPGETGILVHARGRDADGSWRPVEILGLSLLDDEEVGGMVMSMRDLSQQAAVADSPARLRSMVDRTTDVVLLVDAGGAIAYANRRLTSQYGIDQDRVVDRLLTSIILPDDVPAIERWYAELLEAGDRAIARIRARIVDPQGVPHDVEWHGTNQLGDPLIDGVIVSGRDITELVAMEAQVREQTDQLVHSASHDALTGLLNRRAFMEQVGNALSTRREIAVPDDVVVLFCDLDRFKAVNDTNGHEAGDQVLVTVARRLRATVRDQDIVARYGGDEFTILLGDGASPAAVTGMVARLKAKLAEPIVWAGITADIGVTVGVCRAKVSDASAEAILRDADAAMYAQKVGRR
jgi:diguanylate cyclase (GGDEF)-like protein/PAS domain S-box-containing protein